MATIAGRGPAESRGQKANSTTQAAAKKRSEVRGFRCRAGIGNVQVVSIRRPGAGASGHEQVARQASPRLASAAAGCYEAALLNRRFRHA